MNGAGDVHTDNFEVLRIFGLLEHQLPYNQTI